MDNFIITNISDVLEYSTNETNWVSAKRSHHILAYQLSGFYFHYFENTALLIKPNTLFFINQKDFYRVEQKIQGHSTSLVVHFFTDKPIEQSSFGVNLFENSPVKNDFYKLLNAWKTDKENNHFYSFSILYKLLNTLNNHTKKGYITTKSQNLANMIASKIETNYQEKIDYEKLAKHLGISTRYLNKLFHLQYGITPNQYLINYRISKAMELLISTQLKIEEIALKTGFSDSYYFSKFFKKQTGTSPTAFRKQYT